MKKRTKAAAASKGSDRLFRIIIILLAFILVLMLIGLGAKIRYSFSAYTSTPNEILRSIQNGRYVDAIDQMHYNIAAGENPGNNGEFMVPYALLDYYEAESLYTGYMKAAENEEDAALMAALEAKASEYRTDMDAASNLMGELEFMTSDIDSVFN